MPIATQLKNISIKSDLEVENYFNFQEDFSCYYKDFKLLCLIYNQSIIGQHDYYLTSVAISKISSNNQSVIDKMEYFVFNNYLALHEETEKKGQDNNSTQSSPEEMFTNMQSGMSGNMKKMSSNFNKSMPKIS